MLSITIPSSIKITLAGMLGNVIEVYDLLIFGFMSPFLAATFLPQSHEISGFANLLLIFGVSYFARPVGGVAFGLMADIVGRKKSLIWSMAILTSVSILIALIPSASTIGTTSVVLLVVLRFIQGFSYGNEFANSIFFLSEHAKTGEKCYRSSFSISGAQLGIFLASLITLILTTIFNTNEMQQWGWRIAFALSIPGGFLAIYIRRNLPETMTFIRLKSDHLNTLQSSLSGIGYIKKHWVNSVALISIVFLGSYSTYLLFLYVPTSMHIMDSKMENHPFLILNCISTLILAIIIPFFGKLADKISIYTIISFSIIGLVLFGAPYLLLVSSLSFFQILPLQILTTIPCAGLFCCGSIATVNSLPEKSRGLGSSILYTAPAVIFGGMAPFLTLKTTTTVNSDWSILIIFIPLAVFALIGSVRASKECPLIGQVKNVLL